MSDSGDDYGNDCDVCGESDTAICGHIGPRQPPEGYFIDVVRQRSILGGQPTFGPGAFRYSPGMTRDEAIDLCEAHAAKQRAIGKAEGDRKANHAVYERDVARRDRDQAEARAERLLSEVVAEIREEAKPSRPGWTRLGTTDEILTILADHIESRGITKETDDE